MNGPTASVICVSEQNRTLRLLARRIHLEEACSRPFRCKDSAARLGERSIARGTGQERAGEGGPEVKEGKVRAGGCVLCLSRGTR